MGSFALDIKRFADKAQGRMDLAMRKTALDLFTAVVLKTPVGNPSLWITKYPPKGYIGGTARGNWQCSVGLPSGSILEQPDPSGAGAINRIAMITRTWDPGTVDSIFLVNNLPYIFSLENGHSRQAPYGMVMTSLREFPYIVERAAADG